MYDLYIKPYADKIFLKLAKKEKITLEIIYKKIQDIRQKLSHKYKFLHSPLQNFNRVHILKSFVLVFKIDYINKIIEIWTYEHHDNVYKGK
jgi:mRNA-degrading endonuclease RelE of RelBE toxin-antitoxin system